MTFVQEKLNPAGMPSVEPKELTEGKDFFEYIAPSKSIRK